MVQIELEKVLAKLLDENEKEEVIIDSILLTK